MTNPADNIIGAGAQLGDPDPDPNELVWQRGWQGPSTLEGARLQIGDFGRDGRGGTLAETRAWLRAQFAPRR